MIPWWETMSNRAARSAIGLYGRTGHPYRLQPAGLVFSVPGQRPFASPLDAWARPVEFMVGPRLGGGIDLNNPRRATPTEGVDAEG